MTAECYVHCIFIPVTNLKRSVHWYSTVLGFRLLWMNSEFASCCLEPSGTKLTLAHVRHVIPLQFEHNGTQHPIVTLGTPDIDGCYRSLAEAGADPEPIVSFPDGHTCFIVKDLDGHPVYISHTP
ncbi:VOC family protein [Paenibacillus sp. SYP-B4298]|uniref:VOC family protein n=1 Tax=Paenibacillus sp. SYP-B4298 TaxID=2996034 RepID=UPI0022DCF162|nr:VOC family protein [Paenibacillus sp. SYP-B4298]